MKDHQQLQSKAKKRTLQDGKSWPEREEENHCQILKIKKVTAIGVFLEQCLVYIKTEKKKRSQWKRQLKRYDYSWGLTSSSCLRRVVNIRHQIQYLNFTLALDAPRNVQLLGILEERSYHFFILKHLSLL